MKRTLALILFFALLLSVPSLAASEERGEEEAVLREAGIQAIKACIDDSMTDVEKLTALHDWLALHCDYGATVRGETAYGALVEGVGNCVGYAEAYAYLAALAGLEGVSTYSESLDHAWILVTLDGARYFSDCTWDDGKHEKLGLIRHRYWLFNEENASLVGHSGWDSDEHVPGGALEYAPWRDAVTRVIFEGRYAYYIDSGFVLRRCDRNTWETEPLYASESFWPDDTGELYTSLVFFGGRLFFNTPSKIYSVDTDGREVRTVLEPVLDEGESVYGIAVLDGMLVYTAADEAGAILYDTVTVAPVRSAWGIE